MGDQINIYNSNSHICLLKDKMRKQISTAKNSISKKEMLDQSSQLCDIVQSTEDWINSKTVLLYRNINKEISVNSLIEQGLNTNKIVALPRYESKHGKYSACVIKSLKDLVVGKYNIMEPSPKCNEVNINQLDLVIVPGVAFDRFGGRLGRGSGYYDRFLKNLKAIFYGVCFKQQVVDKTPQDLHDAKMDIIMTPDGKLDLN